MASGKEMTKKQTLSSTKSITSISQVRTTTTKTKTETQTFSSFAASRSNEALTKQAPSGSLFSRNNTSYKSLPSGSQLPYGMKPQRSAFISQTSNYNKPNFSKDAVPAQNNLAIKPKYNFLPTNSPKLYNSPINKPAVNIYSTINEVPIYEVSMKNRGKVLIINNKTVKGETERRGAEKDEENLKKLFSASQGWSVSLKTNLSKKEMMNTIQDHSRNKGLKKYSVNIVIIMSHGTGEKTNDSTEICGKDGQTLPITWIIEQFCNHSCPQLQNKPKIFIFQCCRGSNSNKIESPHHDAMRKYSDMLIAYATVPGCPAWRDPNSGSFYIQTLCDVFEKYGKRHDIDSLLKIVDKNLEVTMEREQQTSSFEVRGFKKCYLYPKELLEV